MTKLTKEKELQIMGAFMHVIMHFTINDYARELVALGLKKSGDKISVEEFCADMDFADKRFDDVEGAFIDGNGCVRNGVEDKCLEEFFNFHMSCIFENAPMTNSEVDFNANGLMKFADDTGEYISGCFPLFIQAVNSEVSYDAFDLIVPYSPEIIKRDKDSAVKFLADIKLKGLKAGSDVSRYFKNAVYIPYFVSALIEQSARGYILKDNDINGIAYKLALFTCFDFMRKENSAIMELKCKQLLNL